ncbi:hypothetical protein [Streptomyces sp. NPDC018000]|uniref:hypothetical protein n=1 Tax=Streptomyces sp. NPDC018000 TaxID=3365028 RepID=UPI0037B353F7
MKQSAVRILGVAALGAAFAAAAGTASASVLPANAAAAPLPVADSALGTATRSVPVQDTATKLVGTDRQELAGNTTAPVKGLIGGLPAGSLSTNGLSSNSLPLGG